MKTKTIKLITAAILGFGLLFTACKKDETTANQDTSFSNDDALAESIYDDISDISDEAYDLGSSNLKSTDVSKLFLSDCVTITLDTTVSPKELTIDFGEENCLCNDGKYRRGKIIVTFTGRYKDPGTVITTGFDNYFVDDNQVDGTKVLTNMGPNEDGQPYFTIVVTGVIYLADDAGTISWNPNKTRTWAEGYTTKNKWDDVYLIDGDAEGIRASGIKWEREIINPLRKELSCRWIVSGTVEIRPQDLPVRLLDFGDGTCDNEATILIDGVTYTITLKNKFKWRKN
jgi:hypothetical protein